MSEENSQMQQMKPYIIVAGVLFILLIVLVFWPSSDDADEGVNTSLSGTVEMPATGTEVPPAIEPVLSEAPAEETEVFAPPQMPTEVVIGEESEAVEALEPVIEEAEEVALDVSDAAVKMAVVQAIRSPKISEFLTSDALLQKFVINVNNLANEEITLRDNLLTPPEQDFSVYRQADKIWIDRSSFVRYTPYIDALETVDTDELLKAYESYKPTLVEKFAEISRPGESLDATIIRAIDELLDTPLVPVPIEVISETVMYKFADPKLEALSGPQKQLVRMGPDNMRRFKDVLRDIKAELEAKQ
ncbi:DUF3014 domain-containing protein [Glaciecola siphonariae]|uniref:DUF3014 domain-containing protein n=1 Tax=Glaciecola siphonariae TaxID=521012 RepID=A0ABV9LS91_9ALTE